MRIRISLAQHIQFLHKMLLAAFSTAASTALKVLSLGTVLVTAVSKRIRRKNNAKYQCQAQCLKIKKR